MTLEEALEEIETLQRRITSMQAAAREPVIEIGIAGYARGLENQIDYMRREAARSAQLTRRLVREVQQLNRALRQKDLLVKSYDRLKQHFTGAL